MYKFGAPGSWGPFANAAVSDVSNRCRCRWCGRARIVDMVSIRPAVFADVADVVDLWERQGGPTRSAGGRAEAIRLITCDGDALLLAEDRGLIVGSVIVGWDGWRCHLYRLVVEPAARRRGIGTDLIAAARERARRLGSSRLDAMVDPDNESAVLFWEAGGFERDRDHRWSLHL